MNAVLAWQDDEDAEEAAEDDEEEDEEDMEGGSAGRKRRYPLRDRTKVQVQPYVPGTGGGQLRRAGCACQHPTSYVCLWEVV